MLFRSGLVVWLGAGNIPGNLDQPTQRLCEMGGIKADQARVRSVFIGGSGREQGDKAHKRERRQFFEENSGSGPAEILELFLSSADGIIVSISFNHQLTLI